MTIHFIASKGKIDQEVDSYRKIISEIKKQGHSLASEWVDTLYNEGKGNLLDKSPTDWAKIDQENTAAISKADIVIVEATHKSFFVGYQVSEAVHQKKPILILTRDDSFPGSSGINAKSDLVTSFTYTDNNLSEIIGKFMDENDIRVKDMRFNFFIDRKIYNFLRWSALRTGKTKAEILRDLVEKEIDRESA